MNDGVNHLVRQLLFSVFPEGTASIRLLFRLLSKNGLQRIQDKCLNHSKENSVQYGQQPENHKSGQKNSGIDYSHGVGDIDFRILFVQDERDDVKAYGCGFRADAQVIAGAY